MAKKANEEITVVEIESEDQEIVETKKANKKIEEPTIEQPVSEKDTKKDENNKKKEDKKKQLKDKEDQDIRLEKEKNDLKKYRKLEKKALKKAKKEQVEAQKVLKNRPNLFKAYFKKNSGKCVCEIKDFIASDDQKAIERAYTLLGIKESDYNELIVVKIPDSFDNTNQVKYRLDTNDDCESTLLYDQTFLNLLFFGNEKVFNYHVNIDYNTGKMANDQTITFNYIDVVSVETKLNYDQITQPKYLQFSILIHLSNSQSISLNLRNQRLDSSNEIDTLLTEQEQNIIKILKEKIQK